MSSKFKHEEDGGNFGRGQSAGCNKRVCRLRIEAETVQDFLLFRVEVGRKNGRGLQFGWGGVVSCLAQACTEGIDEFLENILRSFDKLGAFSDESVRAAT